MFRFTIRELVLLNVIVAVCLGWALDHITADVRHWEEREAAEEYGQLVEFINERYDRVWKDKWGWHALEKGEMGESAD